MRGKDIFGLNETKLTIFRRRNIGFVFQNYNLVPILNVYENIVLPIELDGEEPDKKYVEEIIETLGIKDKIYNLPNQLSGGQQQRVAIARALASKPAILLADEPTGNLDSKTSQEVLGLLKLTNSRFSQTIVMITHSEELAQLCDRIIGSKTAGLSETGGEEMRNNNRKVIGKLSSRNMKKNRMRNLFAIGAICLTSLLFTAVFSMGIGMGAGIPGTDYDGSGRKISCRIKECYQGTI